jgi:hypothetical protein
MESSDTETAETTDRTTRRDDVEDMKGYDPATKTLHAQYDVDNEESVLLGIVETIAAVSERNPHSMTPLYEAIDVESLTSLMTGSRKNEIEVAFTYEEYRVVVSGIGEIIVQLRG